MNGEAQTSGSVLMVRPASFGFHAEAAESNVFAHAEPDTDLTAALREFDGVVQRLTDAGVEVLILDDTPDPPKPDAVFPNNWVTFHADGTMVLYPMATAARRLERNPEGLKALLASHGFGVRRAVDLSIHERDGEFLEGTGSLVLDRPRRRAYANLSPRTDAAAIADFDERLGWSTLIFEARDRAGRPIYHTNVAMSFGARFAMLCTEAIVPEYRERLIAEIGASGRTLIEVDYEQMGQFACNLIELSGRDGPAIALSSTARRSFKPQQLRLLESFGELVDADIPTIETVGGGSVRCMIADIHLPRPA
ncbi:MAG TPA: arginine deiminase-related protein [Sphingomicrobium sp.]|nr:arginine deiminase-related protein [Sphingomicrobium sp.]